MDPRRWAHIQDVFHAALELPLEQRDRFVRERCAGAPEDAEQVLELLAEDVRSGSLLDREIGVVADSILDGSIPKMPQIGPYRILRVLGQGGMGVVYLGERPDLGARAAIKVLRDAALSPHRRERFLSEQRTLAQLEHPRIARIFDAAVLPDGTPYFVMEHVEGRPLDRYCAEVPLRIDERLHLFRAICEGVRFAHSRAVIHRDLKPSNVLVTEDGTPKLLDFGIAKQLDSLDGVGDRTRTGLALMTPAYAAPEQILGQPLGVYTDVYALGGLLYQILSGRPPFDLQSLTPAQAERAITETGAPPPSRVADPASAPGPTRPEWEELDILCGTAMHRDPLRRYASVEALMRDVDHFLADEPLEARPDSALYRLGKFARRNTRALTGVATAMAALAGTVGFYTWRLADARDQALAEAQRTQRIQAFTQSLFTGGQEEIGPSDTLRVLTLLDRGVQQARLLDADPAQQADMYVTLGSIFTQLGRYASADSLLGLAVALRQALTPADPHAVAEALVAEGELRLQQGEYEEAEGIFQRALELQRAEGPPTDPRIASSLTGLGSALEGRGEYERAITLLGEAVRALEAQPGREEDLTSALAALANTQFYAGDLDASDSLNLRALAIYRRLHGERHPDVADGLINLAVNENQRGRYDAAEPLLRQALSIFEGYHGPEHPEVASALRMLGNNLIYQGRLDDAEPLLRRSLSVGERVLGPNHPRQANTLGDLAYVELQKGRFDEAIEAYRRIVTIYEEANGPRHYFVGIGLSNLANAYMEAGRLTESEAIFRDVIERFAEARGAEHVDTGIAHIKLGRVLLRQERASAAERELLAGYDIVRPQMEPTVSWLRAARTDLASAYDALGRPQDAERFRREQAGVDSLAAAER
ncbi:MAG: serine/threonine-protein kinase [Gemmatimonadota bacterium]